MEIEICEIGYDKKEYIKIGCHKVDSNVKEIVNFIKSRQGSIDVKNGEMKYNIPIVDIFYVESVDDRTFIYLSGDCYETAHKLYELEEILNERRFIRISKSVIVNLLKIECVKPALNGRYLCHLTNGEDVIISRKYVHEFKEKLSR
ncbi:MAG: LytTR family transcriptional regulator DNA-binding domain-containing protein [Lachnospiraceae bacterium]|nr:LytTR family transcriptional regulator DNA-binding domain-containing protein [Lachnospiraceae bacterium]